MNQKQTSQPSLFASLPDSLRPAAAQAVQALHSGQVEIARRRFERLLKRAPDDADLLRLTGMAQRMSGRNEPAIKTLERARKIAPSDPLVASSLGLAQLAVGQQEQGLAELQRACDLAPQSAPLWNNLGKALIDCNRVPESVEPLRKAVELQENLSLARFSLAYALTVSGEVEAAAGQYRILLSQRPDDGEVWMGLAQLKSGLLEQADIETMQRLLAGTIADPGDRIALNYALGQALHDKKQYPAAFAAWQDANRVLRERKPWDAAKFSQTVDQVIAIPWKAPEKPAARPRVIFIVGLPRSGTSLTERILGMHSSVVAGGELDVLGRLLHDMAERRGGTYPQGLESMTRGEWQRLGEVYLERARAGLENLPVVTDKRPGNWLFAGAALSMLPDARVVVCRRDPVEVGFSCWRNRFSYQNQLFSYDFDSIAAHWHDFDRACRHWQNSFPDRVMNFSYESLLDDSEQAIRQLLQFCDLPFEADCLHPENSTDIVRTLSATQVRKPLQRGSAISERYGELLDPLRHALGRYRNMQ
ncbi:MAG: sulfotransferase [Rhodanobacteraceae bacterium]